MTNIKRSKRIRIFTFLFLGIVRDFYKEVRLARRHGLNIARKRMSKRHRKRAIQMRETALKMGGVLIKLGQFFSSRVDVMPEEYIDELAKLQDMVPPVPFEEIKEVIESEFNLPLNRIFRDIEKEPQAAASLAQVHYATLMDKTPVAVKVQRPDIQQLIDIDLATFGYLMEGVDKFTSFGKKVDIPKIIMEFTKTLGDELDFLREGYNAERFRQNFQNEKTIYIPKVYFRYTSNKVITLERINAIKISNYKALERKGIDRSAVAQEVAQSYFKQVLEDGFFHADPHPGNLFVVEGPEITFVDFGMVGEISPQAKEDFRELIIGVATRDVDRIVNSFIALGFLRRGMGSFSVKKTIKWMLDNYSSITTNTLSIEDIEDINEDLKKIMRDEPFTISAEFAFLGRAIGTLHGLAIGLDPDFNAVEAVGPYVKKLTSDQNKNITQVVIKEVSQTLRLLAGLPRKIDEIVSSMQQGKFSVKVEARDVVRAIDRSTKNQRQISLTIITSVLVISSVALLLFMFKNEAYVGFGISFILIFFSLVRSRANRRRYF